MHDTTRRSLTADGRVEITLDHATDHWELRVIRTADRRILRSHWLRVTATEAAEVFDRTVTEHESGR